MNCFNLNNTLRAGTMTPSPCGFLSRIQMRTELIWDTYIIRDGGVWGLEFHWLLISSFPKVVLAIWRSSERRYRCISEEIHLPLSLLFPNVSASSLPFSFHLGWMGVPPLSCPFSATRAPEPYPAPWTAPRRWMRWLCWPPLQGLGGDPVCTAVYKRLEF